LACFLFLLTETFRLGWDKGEKFKEVEVEGVAMCKG